MEVKDAVTTAQENAQAAKALANQVSQRRRLYDNKDSQGIEVAVALWEQLQETNSQRGLDLPEHFNSLIGEEQSENDQSLGLDDSDQSVNLRKLQEAREQVLLMKQAQDEGGEEEEKKG